MSEFYTKSDKGEYIPISFDKIVTKDWDEKLVLVRIGSEENPAKEDEINQTMEGLNNADALYKLKNASFLITLHNIDFEKFGSVKEIAEQNIAVKVTADDDLSKLSYLQKEAKSQLRGKVKKVVTLPVPLTVQEYKEVMDIKKRCDTRRERRGK